MDYWLESIKRTYLKASKALKGGVMGKRTRYVPRTVWDLLAAEGNYALINTLKMVERRETGYGTMIIPVGGYSKDPETHKAVVRWLESHCEHTSYSPVLEAREMEEALHA